MEISDRVNGTDENSTPRSFEDTKGKECKEKKSQKKLGGGKKKTGGRTSPEEKKLSQEKRTRKGQKGSRRRGPSR